VGRRPARHRARSADRRGRRRLGAGLVLAAPVPDRPPGLGLVPAERAARVTDTGITWNYTTILNIVFLLVAAALVIRFVRSGSAPMLTMMGGCSEEHARDHSEVLLHDDDAQPAQQVLQTQVSDHQDTIAVPSMGKAPAPTVRSRD
jgi:hypothetical protein